MTLVLTLLTPRYILQVSDRLVTTGGQPFDPLSNKNVIYSAKDGFVSIGYTGRAYLEDKPTDQWVAEKLWGEELEEGYTIDTGHASRWLDIGQSVELLRSDCEEVFSKLIPQERDRQQFVVSGWQWRRRRARPIYWEIGNLRSRSRRHSFDAQALSRYWHFERDPAQPKLSRYYVLHIPDQCALSQRELEETVQRLRTAAQSPDVAEGVLVDSVRLAARKSRTVGPDCMCILLSPPSVGTLRARYVPTNEARARISWGKHSADVPAAYSPWIVAPQSASSPELIVGSYQAAVGRFRISVEAPPIPSESPVLGAGTPQPRPPSPGRPRN